MTPPRRLVALVLVAVLQLGATATSIAIYERTLRVGEAIRLRLAPVDPVDPMRGYYLALRFEEQLPASASVDAGIDTGDDVFASFRIDEQGFARVARISRHRPTNGPYLCATFHTRLDTPNSAGLEFPLDRFYVGEATAATVDQVRLGRDPGRDDHAVVRVLEGRGVIESLVVDGKDVASGRAVTNR